jgi:predicted kinase
MYFSNNEPEPTSQIYDNTQFKVFIMSGISGSGKDTYISDEPLLNCYPVVCRDDVRIELGMCKPGEKCVGTKEQESKVSAAMDEKIKKYCRNKETFIVNNMNNKKIWREKLIRQISVYEPEIIIIYVETLKDNYFKRRKGQVPTDVLIKMQKELEIPYPTECYQILYERN